MKLANKIIGAAIGSITLAVGAALLIQQKSIERQGVNMLKNSVHATGKDIVSFAMEGWKAGEVHGAFILKTDFSRVDASVRESMITCLDWIGVWSLGIVAGFAWMNQRQIIRPLRAASAAAAHVDRPRPSVAHADRRPVMPSAEIRLPAAQRSNGQAWVKPAVIAHQTNGKHPTPRSRK